MEVQKSLDPLNQSIWQSYTMCSVRRSIASFVFWSDAWAGHRMRTTKSSPLVMWTSEQLLNPVVLDEGVDIHDLGVEGFVIEDVMEGDGPIFLYLYRI